MKKLKAKIGLKLIGFGIKLFEFGKATQVFGPGDEETLQKLYKERDYFQSKLSEVK